MRFIAVLVLGCGTAVAGCGASMRSVHVALELTGTGAGAGEQQRCVDAARRAGAIVDANAPVQALVTVEQDGTRRLQVVTMRQGIIRDEKRGHDSIETVCQDAVAAAASARSPAVQQPSTRTGTVGEPAAAPSASGNAYRGPISE